MKVVGGNQVFLEVGEIVPVFCGCGHIYQPKEMSYSSTCAKCGARNIHTGDVEIVRPN